MNNLNKQRRNFLKASAVGGLSTAMGLPGTIAAQTLGSGFADYKALVCVFLAGGNDSWNTFVPATQAEYNAYSNSRGGTNSRGLAISRSDLLNVDGGQHGFHPSMEGMRSLYDSGDCAVIANVGPLVKPTSPAQFRETGFGLPPQLFSHNDQQDQWHTLRGESLSTSSGWGGRIADAFSPQLSGQQLPTNLSLSGTTLFHAGDLTTPYVMGIAGATDFDGLDPGDTISRTFQDIATTPYDNIYQRGFGDVQRRAFDFSDTITSNLVASRDFQAFNDLLSNGDLDPDLDLSLAIQLRTVAKIISRQSQLSMSRQIFFVQLGGFDTHDNQNDEQPLLLESVSRSMKAFHDAMGEINMQNAVTAYTASDFARTLTSNGDGSDHGWGGLQFAVGGSVNGGQVYGDYPVLELGSEFEIGRGRFIPTISSDQYCATLASWFGVNSQNLRAIAPGLDEFPESLQNLGFMV